MHIPDGYLGPGTCVATYGVMVPCWVWAARRVRRSLSIRRLPLLALGAAFAFVLMMFNIPVPGGTTGHATGSVLVAILLGPWAAVVAISVTLAVQALLFGDGGVTALGANCLTMAVIMPFSGYWIYRLAAAGASAGSRRRWFAAALGGYIGLNLAAVGVAVLLGVQPALAHDSLGRALYCPFPLGVALPAMALSHLLFLGFVEAAVTGLVVAYLSKVEPSLLADLDREKTPSPRRSWRPIAWGLGVLVLLLPLAYLFPGMAGAGEAWGEWGGERLQALAGHLPEGFRRLEGLWRAPLPDYAPAGVAEGTSSVGVAWYLASGLLGAFVVATILLAASRFMAGRGTRGHDS